MIVVFSKVVGIMLLILIGYITNKLGIFPDESKKYLTNMLLYITAPCMGAYSIYTKELSDKLVSSTIQVLIGAGLYFAVMTVIIFFMVKALKFKPKPQWGVYIAAMVSVNNGFMGFPVTKQVFGDDLFYLMVIHNVSSCIFLYGVLPVILYIGREKNGEKTLLSNIKAAVNPCIVGVLLGLFMLFMDINPPQTINDIVKYLSDATVPVSMILIGVQLGSSRLRDILKNKYVVLATFIKMFIVPAITFALVYICPVFDDDVKLILIFASVFPTAVVTSALAEKEGIEGNTGAEIVSITTAISLLVIPIMATILTHVYL